MLVKVSKSYAGMYGVFNEDIKSVTIKTRESAPFEENDALSLRMIKKGVLVKADGKPEKPVKEEKKPEPVKEEALPFPEGESVDPDDVIKSLDDMSMKELREEAKSYGISYKVGMSKEQLINDIRNAVDELPPVMAAAEPE